MQRIDFNNIQAGLETINDLEGVATRGNKVNVITVFV
jgi:hypothetical protein